MKDAIKDMFLALKTALHPPSTITTVVLFIVIVLFIIMCLPPSPANAQTTICVEHSILVKKLKQSHQEKPIAMGLASNGAIIEVFVSPEGDTWTVVRTTPDGTSCVLGVGEGWMEMEDIDGEIS